MGTLLTHAPSTKYCTLALYRCFLDFIRTVYLPAPSPIIVFSITRPLAALDQVLALNPLILSVIPVDSPCKEHQKRLLPCSYEYWEYASVKPVALETTLCNWVLLDDWR